MHKVNDRNAIKRCEIYSKLRVKKPDLGHWHLHWTYFTIFSSISIVNFEQINEMLLGFHKG